MNRIENDEIFANLTEFLKAKGVELTEGSYTRVVQKSCALLTEAINCSKEGFEKVKGGLEKKLDQMRQVVHEKTAPKKTAATVVPPRMDPAEAPPAAPPTAPPASPKLARTETSVLALNANGIAGAAAATGERVRGQGHLGTHVRNAARTEYRRSVVL